MVDESTIIRRVASLTSARANDENQSSFHRQEGEECGVHEKQRLEANQCLL